MGYVNGIYQCETIGYSLCRQDLRIMFGNNVVHLIDQVRAFKDKMSSAFLKVTNAEELILVFLLMRIITDNDHLSHAFMCRWFFYFLLKNVKRAINDSSVCYTDLIKRFSKAVLISSVIHG